MSGTAMADQNMSIVAGIGDMAATAKMPTDMSCCFQKQAKIPDCSKDCPLNVLCVTGFSSVSAANVDTFSVFGQKDLFRFAIFEALASRIGDPPHRPPSV
ncbi:hypothetical protein LJR231_000634 [Phyllobacterium sp. LjRoot231]|uniref:hypothetical protein n=1 Tax=Phyllobacterium sp. LjRoot231 TaxID=3342289 RepID=UPI003ECE3DE9